MYDVIIVGGGIAGASSAFFLKKKLAKKILFVENIMERKKKYDEKFVRKTLRFTPDEFAKIEEQREKTNLDFTNYAKKAIMNKRVIAKVEEDFTRALIYELNKIGNNINQIAKGVKTDKVQVLQELIKIEKHLKDLTNVRFHGCKFKKDKSKIFEKYNEE